LSPRPPARRASERRTARPRLSVAPMMALTDRHFRRLARLLTQRALLYTEMVTAKAVLHGDAERLLARSPAEGAVVLQLGGSDPAELKAAGEVGARFGYVELNLNVGCPSDRVRSGRFGACLMAEPTLEIGRASCRERVQSEDVAGSGTAKRM